MALWRCTQLDLSHFRVPLSVAERNPDFRPALVRQAGCRGAKCTDSSLCPDDSVVVKLPAGRIEATVKAGLDTAVGVLSAERSHAGRFTSGARVW